ncbi:hypothetical protein M8998_02070 [Sphingobacterium sp. lm-10]|uniref:hypothetical protein n=1 Tax=Sphingobacterium sp. lm-10 TaxID=2944904 RepID=UPI002020E676|nr:hypothetical protein [Sphingobacterium sp. lm-10]MCL7986718.1 hypothetical protein [Sphingobacterium sp. lm-10]
MIALFKRLFVTGFYKHYAGLFLLVALSFIGLCPPGEHWRVFVNLALATISYWPALAIILTLTLTYQYLIVYYVFTILNTESYRFFKLGVLSFSFYHQRLGWLLSLLGMFLPLLFFLITAICVGMMQSQFLFTFILLAFTISTLGVSYYAILRFAEPLTAKDTSGLWTVLGAKLGLNYPMLGIRYLLYRQQLAWVIAKLLSYIFVSILFFIYSDVKEHQGIIMIALTSIAMAHISVLSGQFKFERHDLALWRNLPYRKSNQSLHVFCRVAIILLPETVWLLYRYPFIASLSYLFYMFSFTYFLYHLHFLFKKGSIPIQVTFFLYFCLLLIAPMAPIFLLGLFFLLFSIGVFYKSG